MMRTKLSPVPNKWTMAQIPPITTRWPCAIVHLFGTGDNFSPHHTLAIDLRFSPGVSHLNQPCIVCLIPVSQPSSDPFTVSLISQAANHCLTAQANISSGAMIVQIIIFTRRDNPFQYPDGGTFGWTDTQSTNYCRRDAAPYDFVQ